MIIFDLNQILYSNIMMFVRTNKDSIISEDLIRHMVLSSIKSINTKFKSQYGNIVIACDSSNYWRRKYFAYYKASRVKQRNAIKIDWTHVFLIMSNIKKELAEYFPYHVINIDGAEADDVISVLSHKYGNTDTKILIVSGDKDYIQLQKFSNVSQYDPVRKKMIKHTSPQKYLREHILRGDVGDGIPNVLSVDSSFVAGIKQKPITSKKMDHWLSLSDEEVLRDIPAENYIRNQNLIDLSKIPSDISASIFANYETQHSKPSRLFEYFMKYNLKNLMGSINHF